MSKKDGSVTDYFLYNGPIDKAYVLGLMEKVAKFKASDDACLLLVTTGGDPDAAYKIAKYFQDKYTSFTVCLPGICKSAGTLIATSASELSFAPFGELGPLDIQLSKRDDLMGLESGLNINEAFTSLGTTVRETYNNIILDILQSSGGVISFQTASEAASDIIAGIYGPIYAQIEPDEVGSRARAMRIGQEYAWRLNEKFENTDDISISKLCQMYPSHGFVIDKTEASTLFKNVRNVNEVEAKIVQKLNSVARYPSKEVVFECINNIIDMPEIGESPHAETPNPDEGRAKRTRKAE